MRHWGLRSIIVSSNCDQEISLTDFMPVKFCDLGFCMGKVKTVDIFYL